MNDTLIKDMLSQFCIVLNSLNDMQKSINEMRDSVKNIMGALDEELCEIKPIKKEEVVV